MLATAIAGMLFLPTAGSEGGQDLPGPLERCVRARNHITNAHIEWGRFGTDRTEFATTRIAGSDVIMIRNGDADGVVVRQPDGSPAKILHGKQMFLAREDSLYIHLEDNIVAEMHPRDADPTTPVTCVPLACPRASGPATPTAPRVAT